MSNSHEMRRYMNILTESKDVDTETAEKLLTKMSPTYRSIKQKGLVIDETMGLGMLGATIALVIISVGGQDIAPLGPFEINGAEQMVQTIEQDIERAYETAHPHGWTDGSGTIYRLSDWDVRLETMHSSELEQFQQQQNQ